MFAKHLFFFILVILPPYLDLGSGFMSEFALQLLCSLLQNIAFNGFHDLAEFKGH